MDKVIKYKDAVINLNNVFFYRKHTFDRLYDDQSSSVVYSIEFHSTGKNRCSIEFETEQERDTFFIGIE
jgi:hypothetical protein